MLQNSNWSSSIIFIALTFWFCSCDRYNTSKNISDSNNTSVLVSYNYGKKNKEITREVLSEYCVDKLCKLQYQYHIADKPRVYTKNYCLPQTPFCHYSYLDTMGRLVRIDLLDSLVCPFKNAEIIVYKYKYNRPLSFDEEELIYYTQGIGVVRTESYIWLNHTLLSQNERYTEVDFEQLHKTIDDSMRTFYPWAKDINLPSPIE